MGKNPEVDVVMITYNQEKFLEKTIESVLNQTYGNIRKIIIADDGSSDGTSDIISKYAHEFPVIQPILASENKGIAHNINRAFKFIKAEYISIIAGDDLMLPEKIEKQVIYLNENHDVVVCSHDMDVFNAYTGESMGRFSEVINFKRFNGKVGVEYLFDPAMLQCPSSYMYRRRCIPEHGFDTRLKAVNELIFDVEVLRHGKLGYMDEILGRYGRHDNNVSGNDKIHKMGLEEFLIAYSIITARYPELYSLVKKGKSSLYFAKVMRCIMGGNKKRARNLSKVLLSEGNYIKGTIAYILSFILNKNIVNMAYNSKYQHRLMELFLKNS